MPRIYLLFIIIVFTFSNSFADGLPPIYISPNPTVEDVYFHSGNPEIIKISEKSINFSISDALKNNSSLSLSKSGGIGAQNQLRIRGSEANHVLVLIDGIEVNDPSSGSEYDFAHFFSHNLENIEILRGSYSSVHGPDAVSGVISINTKNKNGANITTGSNNLHIQNYSLAGENKFFQYGLDINLSESSGIDTSGTSGDRNRYENENFRINLKSINHSLSIFYFDIFRENDRDASGNPVDNEFAKTDINQFYSQYYYKDKISKNISTKQGIQYSTNKNLDFSYINGVWEALTQSEKFKAFFNSKINLGNFTGHISKNSSLSLGIEYEKVNFTQLVQASGGAGDQIQNEYNSSFASELILPFKNAQIELSLRRTINQRFINNNSHRVGFTYKLNNGKFFINHATAFKNPTFTERFGYYPGTFNGNENLKPESTRQLEFGYFKPILQNTISFAQTYYYMKLLNEINGFTSDGKGGYTAKNIVDKSYRKGLETQIEMFFSKNSKMTFKHDYIDSTYYSSSLNKQVLENRRPRNIFNIIYENTFLNNMHINANILYSSKIKDTSYFSYPYQTVYLKEYTLANIKINYLLDEKNKISFTFNNIFNRKYNEIYGFETPGFEFLLNYSRSF